MGYNPESGEDAHSLADTNKQVGMKRQLLFPGESRRTSAERSGEMKRPPAFQESTMTATSLVVQWLRLGIPNAGGSVSIPHQGT